jgi:hypothetical protein
MTNLRRNIDHNLYKKVENAQLRILIKNGISPKSFNEKKDSFKLTFFERATARIFLTVFSILRKTVVVTFLKQVLKLDSRAPFEASKSSEFREEIIRLCPPTTFLYQREDDYYFVIEHIHQIIQATSTLPTSSPLKTLDTTVSRTLIALAPIGRCNARLISGRFNTAALLLDDGMILLSAQMGALFASLLETNGDNVVLDSNNVSRCFIKNPLASRIYYKIVDDLIYQGKSGTYAHLLPLDNQKIRAFEIFSELAITFILAHELAHIHLGHLNLLSKDEIVDELLPMQAELEADQLAKEILRLVCQNKGYDPDLAGVSSVFIMAIYDSVYDTIGNLFGIRDRLGDECFDERIAVATAHPPAKERIKRLLSGTSPTESWAIQLVSHLKATDKYHIPRQRKPHRCWSHIIDNLHIFAP